MININILLRHFKEYIASSHNDNLNPDKNVEKCNYCHKYTCHGINSNIPFSSVIGHCCKKCIFRLASKVILSFMCIILILKIISLLNGLYYSYVDIVFLVLLLLVCLKLLKIIDSLQNSGYNDLTHTATKTLPITEYVTPDTSGLKNKTKNGDYSSVLHENRRNIRYTITEPVTPDISRFKNKPKIVDYSYILRGNRGNIRHTVYDGLNRYLKELPRSISYSTIPPTDIDFINRDLNDEYQKQFLDLLVRQIKSTTLDKEDQARIAISLVQNINYDTAGFMSGNIKGKYPYEVLYTGSGVCSDKSKLLAYLLRGIGYEVVIFRFSVENHDAIGIKCPLQYSYRGTGYCFIESTTPNIITDASRDYIGVGKLTTMPNILKVCDGSSFYSISEEYNDYIAYYELSNKLQFYSGKTLSQSEYDKWKYYHDEWRKLVNKYGLF